MKKNAILKIKSVEHIGRHKLTIVFSDGKVQAVDFGNFLKNSKNPEIRKYLNLRAFKKFTLKNGELMWGDFDLIFPIADLYENKLERLSADSPRK